MTNKIEDYIKLAEADRLSDGGFNVFEVESCRIGPAMAKALIEAEKALTEEGLLEGLSPRLSQALATIQRIKENG